MGEGELGIEGDQESGRKRGKGRESKYPQKGE
jgi:hypothetical protein